MEHESGLAGVVRKVFHSGMYTLQDTLDKLDFSKVEKMSQVLVQAKRLFIFCLGTSATVGQMPNTACPSWDCGQRPVRIFC